MGAIAFQDELRDLINTHGREKGSDTPDWTLAEYLVGCLEAFNAVVTAREAWYGRGPGLVANCPPEDRADVGKGAAAKRALDRSGQRRAPVSSLPIDAYAWSEVQSTRLAVSITDEFKNVMRLERDGETFDVPIGSALFVGKLLLHFVDTSEILAPEKFREWLDARNARRGRVSSGRSLVLQGLPNPSVYDWPEAPHERQQSAAFAALGLEVWELIYNGYRLFARREDAGGGNVWSVTRDGSQDWEQSVGRGATPREAVADWERQYDAVAATADIPF